MNADLVRDLFGDRRDWARDFALASAAGIFLGLVGPFGSYLNGSRWIVMAYWMAGLWCGTLIFGVTLRPALRWARRSAWSASGVAMVATVMATIPISVLSRIAAENLWPDVISRIGPLTWYGQTLVISAPFVMGRALLAGRRPRRDEAGLSQTAGPEPEPRSAEAAQPFLARLPSRLGRDVVALQMEDHYVRVHTRLGSALILIPLNQALRELIDCPGMKVHRSWWVAKNAVIGSVSETRNTRLKLSNGLEAPVSRSHVAAVRAAGWLSSHRPGDP